ncbi:hypothetical protein PARHAE_02320 [Paracoccus haematequi]|uniref:Uncharacterized protein n=1 Tax=Paracoccus haematequi TaxID=2491866 RepID=A0A3S4GRG1_9RHOB|nr:hypothetical protein [Paracoccus haematequi]VDS09131.1 hypothetical protein PARHAE_02320 [Paracoccus haematequi]
MLNTYLTAEATRDHLTAARMATLLHEAKSPDAVAFREEVLPLLHESKAKATLARGEKPRNPTRKAFESHRKTLDAILADLIWASDNTEALGYCYRSANRQGFTDEATEATSRVYGWQMPALEDVGLLERMKGFSRLEDFDGDIVAFKGWATRIRATPALLDLAQRYGINAANLYDHYVKRKAALSQPVSLRGGKHQEERGPILTCPDTEQVAELRRQVERINAIYSRHHFEGMPEPLVRRTFNCADSEDFAFNKGGRLYADFQGMRRESRPNIRIDGQEAVELDLKASQLTILYGITKTPMPDGDPYDIVGLPRSVVKAIVTAMIGLGHTNIKRWPSESKKRLMGELGGEQPMTSKTFGKVYPITATAAKVLKRHPVLYHLSPEKLDWADLQFIESEVLISTILELGEKYDIPALPIHDSIIVPKSEDEWGHICLANAFKALVGRKPLIEMKG